MPIEAALCSRDKLPARIEIEAPGALRDAVGKHRLPAAVVVRSEDLELFRECGGLFKDRRVKDDRKGLSALLLSQGGRIPFIEANLSSAGRLKQAIGKLLKNAASRDEAGIYVLGVSAEAFAALWRGAPSGDAPTDPALRGRGLSGLLRPLPGEDRLSRTFWGDSDAHHMVRQLILRAAPLGEPVLILGETGTGKGVVARAIHELGRPGKPFVEVNCAAIPSELLESELFGYMPGAFTSALKGGKAGQWELAKDGTLFLDEVGDLSLDHQTKILHTLQEPKIRRLGAVATIPVEARVVAATNRNLYGMVQAGKFREDLFYRLRQFVIFTPELRDDPHNLKLIAQEAWREIAKTEGRLPAEILDDLCRHRWPGNVRELRSVLSSLNTFFGSEGLRREHLNAVFQHFGLVAGYGQRESEADRPALLQVECLRKIHRSDEAIHACEQALKPVAEGYPLAASGRASLLRIRMEIQALMRNRLYFGSREAYESVARVEECLGHLLALPEDDTHALAQFWQGALAPQIQQAVARLFDELQRLLALSEPGPWRASSRS
jgi:transcriptional regulator with AAA-type ATPase domain